MPEAAAPGSMPAGIRRDGTVLGFDVGARRIGVAVASAFAHGARALAVVDVHGHGPDWNAIDRLHREWRPDGFVVGDPMTLDGGDQPIRKVAHAFAADRAEGRRKRRDAATLDAVAAAIIVERWLAAPHDAIRLEGTSAA